MLANILSDTLSWQTIHLSDAMKAANSSCALEAAMHALQSVPTAGDVAPVLATKRPLGIASCLVVIAEATVLQTLI